MPLVVYIFALTAFALGVAEFVPIALTEVMAHGLGIPVEQAGMTVTAYALGATFAAPVLTALTASWTRKCTMLATVLMFTLGSLTAALANTLSVLLLARFVAGMGHGLFLAVASSTAARLAGQAQAGRAVAVVFGGFTVAMALAVPLGTWLGGVLSWRVALGAIAVCGVVGFAGLWLGMQEPARQPGHNAPDSVSHALKAVFHPVLLWAALVTVLGYAGSFAVFTYISPLLTEVTHVDMQHVGIFMLIYGAAAALGNLAGGRLTDRLGVDTASVVVCAGMVLAALGLWRLAHSVLAMGVLVALLGGFTYAAVPAFQVRVLGMAERHAPHAHGVAAGLNIAGFNFGIALGSFLGSITLKTWDVSWIGLTAAVIAGLGLMVLWGQMSGKGTFKAATGYRTGA